jgi:8-oxo-dGTP pyrophosphatase MutT (NUDIX family)
MGLRIQAVARLRAGRETGRGAGAVFYCPATGRFLLVKRSDRGDDPGTWCCLGGGVDDDDPSFEHTVLREAQEEAGFSGECDLHFMYVCEQPDFSFYNYCAVVPEEFKPRLNDEHTEYQWVAREDFPEPMHEGFMEALNSDSGQSVLKRLGAL